jgi:hypothetical protein
MRMVETHEQGNRRGTCGWITSFLRKISRERTVSTLMPPGLKQGIQDASSATDPVLSAGPRRLPARGISPGNGEQNTQLYFHDIAG